METQQNPKVTRLIPLLVIGMLLNTLGIVFRDIGIFRYVLMAVGIGLILTFIVKAMGARHTNGDSKVE